MYYKAGSSAATTDVPTAEGSYLVTVEIEAAGYVEETLTLGYYTVPAESQVVISFITYAGPAITPITGTNGSIIGNWPTSPEYAGYEFGGWYADATLRTPLGNAPTTMQKSHFQIHSIGPSPKIKLSLKHWTQWTYLG